MKAIEKFYIYLKKKGIAPSRYEKDYGLSNGYLSTQFKRKGSLGELVLKNITENCLDINPEWLLNDNVEMLRVNVGVRQQKSNNLQDLVEFQREKIQNLEKEILSLKKSKKEVNQID